VWTVALVTGGFSVTAGASYEHVYVHVPFCRRRCSYCDFSIAVRRTIPVVAFNDAIMAEVATRGVRLDPPHLKTLYLGGGTPSQLGPEGVADLLARFRQVAGVGELSTFGRDTEITLEVNPEDVTDPAAAAWAEAGVNRVSLGVQSFHGPTLVWMHRGHTPADVTRAVADLRRAGIENISIDLIFAVPVALGRDWPADLSQALALEPAHLSVYGLTVEPHTPLGRWTARGTATEAPEESWAEQFMVGHETLTGVGYEHYEVSNYGRPGRHSRHNRAYWSGAAYLGLGPSAHGFDGSERRWNEPAYAAWLELVRSGADPLKGGERLGADERSAEEVYLGLRTTDGLAIRHSDVKMVTPWIDSGWAEVVADRVRLTADGWLRLDALAAALTSHRSR
jgi:oxygen-independent coproporphyrinogen-3 oxidase